MEGLRHPLTRQLGWSLGSNVLTALWSLTIAIIAARRLDTASFGRLALLLSAQTVISTVMTSAIGQTAIRLTAELRETDRDRLNRVVAMLTAISLALSVLLGLGFLIGGAGIHSTVLGPDAPRDAVLAGALVLSAAGIAALQQGLLGGWGSFDAVAKINAARLAVGIGLLLSLPPTLGSAVGAVAGGAIAGLLVGEVLWRQRRRHHITGVPYRTWIQELSVLWSFAVPSWLTGAFFVLSAWVGNVLTSHQVNGLAEVGRFNAASQWGRSLLLFVPNAVVAPILVTMAALYGKGDRAGLARVTRRGLSACLAATIVPCLIVYLLGPLLLRWYGPAYAQSLPVLYVLLVSTSVASATIIANAALTAADRMWTVAAITGAWAVVFVVTLLLEPNGGALGLAHAYLAGYIVQVLVSIGPTWRVLRVERA